MLFCVWKKKKSLRVGRNCTWEGGRDKLPTPASDDKFGTKKLEWQKERGLILKHGSVVRPTMYLASLDIKTAFDEARLRHVAKITETTTHTDG